MTYRALIIMCRCVYLLSELSNIHEASRQIQQCLPAVADACRYNHYAQHIVFLETVCKQLPIIAKHIGVKPFKAYFDLFIDPIFQALVSTVSSEKLLTDFEKEVVLYSSLFFVCVCSSII